MSKPLTRTQINEKKVRRINDKSLRQLLIHRFLNDYGYDKGEVTATAIVEDILKTVIDENASESNPTHSETIAGKLIDISFPAILGSYDTISGLAVSALP